MGELNELARALLCNDTASVALRVARCEDARIIWVHDDAAGFDDQYAGSEHDRDAYEAHLLERCAFLVQPGATSTEQAWADRYGGSGLGGNGGSGRAANINGYNIKGIGPTPLIGMNNSIAHASGGAFLGEAIRELVFADLFRDMLPHGVSPIIALIDTGTDHRWDEGSGAVERRVLIVRPVVLRPAHFQKACRFATPLFEQKRMDRRRVTANIDELVGRLGIEDALDLIEGAFVGWAEQLSYGVVHDLALGLSPSNITLDGRVLDFGGSSTLPVTANYFTAPGNSTMMDVAEMIESLDEILARMAAVGHELARDAAADIEAAVLRAYEHGLARAVVSAVGLNDARGDRGNATDGDLVEAIVVGYLTHHRLAARLRMNLLPSQYVTTYPPMSGLERIGGPDCPASLMRLREVLEAHLGQRPDAAAGTYHRWKWTSEGLRESIDGHLEAVGADPDVAAIVGMVTAELRS